jgi:hypothetical protein
MHRTRIYVLNWGHEWRKIGGYVAAKKGRYWEFGSSINMLVLGSRALAWLRDGCVPR